VSDGLVVAVGDGDPPATDDTLRFEGKVIFPGFTDGHVHLSWTGLASRGVDLSAAMSRDELLTLARPLIAGEIVGLGFDETQWDDRRLPTLRELDELAPSTPLVLPRIDTYMCVANTAAMRAAGIDGQRGVERAGNGEMTGLLRTEAAAEAHRTYLESVPDGVIVDALRHATQEAVAHGITCVHEMSMPDKRGRRDAEILLASMEELAPDIVLYVADLDIDRVAGLGLARIGGDLFLDGSIGARTAAVGQPYADGEGSGVLTYTDDELQSFLREAHRRGFQVGLHAIGDRAIDQALRGFRAVCDMLDEVGTQAFRDRRHRLEHFEMATSAQMGEAARLGMVASVQPAFDTLWGHPGQLYPQRVGSRRAADMNAFLDMERHGLEIGGGSDTPMSPLHAMAGVWALEHPHDLSQRWARAEALEVFTSRSARLAQADVRKGRIAPGFDADFVVLPADPLFVEDVRMLTPEHTFVRGRLVHSA
jgi:predicted amidohydrolase YtcJ